MARLIESKKDLIWIIFFILLLGWMVFRMGNPSGAP